MSRIIADGLSDKAEKELDVSGVTDIGDVVFSFHDLETSTNGKYLQLGTERKFLISDYYSLVNDKKAAITEFPSELGNNNYTSYNPVDDLVSGINKFATVDRNEKVQIFKTTDPNNMSEIYSDSNVLNGGVSNEENCMEFSYDDKYLVVGHTENDNGYYATVIKQTNTDTFSFLTEIVPSSTFSNGYSSVNVKFSSLGDYLFITLFSLSSPSDIAVIAYSVDYTNDTFTLIDNISVFYNDDGNDTYRTKPVIDISKDDSKIIVNSRIDDYASFSLLGFDGSSLSSLSDLDLKGYTEIKGNGSYGIKRPVFHDNDRKIISQYYQDQIIILNIDNNNLSYNKYVRGRNSAYLISQSYKNFFGEMNFNNLYKIKENIYTVSSDTAWTYLHINDEVTKITPFAVYGIGSNYSLRNYLDNNNYLNKPYRHISLDKTGNTVNIIASDTTSDYAYIYYRSLDYNPDNEFKLPTFELIPNQNIKHEYNISPYFTEKEIKSFIRAK